MSDLVLSRTRALCPVCLGVVDGQTVERNGQVWLVRTCAEHGPAESLILGDAEWWRWSRKFLRPGRPPVAAATERHHGCPYDCGFCPDHQQHACVTVFEITEACNLRCPACFAGDAHPVHATLDDVRAMAQGLLRAEGGHADVVMLSGGEPTLHPQFLEIADELRALPIGYLIVNSNGTRLAHEPGFADELAAREMLVYLQFDGFRPETTRILRGTRGPRRREAARPRQPHRRRCQGRARGDRPEGGERRRGRRDRSLRRPSPGGEGGVVATPVR